MAELLAHVQNTNHQYNLSDTGKLAYKSKRKGIAERFPDISVQKNIELDLSLLNHYDQLLLPLDMNCLLLRRSMMRILIFVFALSQASEESLLWSSSMRCMILTVSPECRILSLTADW